MSTYSKDISVAKKGTHYLSSLSKAGTFAVFGIFLLISTEVYAAESFSAGVMDVVDSSSVHDSGGLTDLLTFGPQQFFVVHPGYRQRLTWDSNVNFENPHERNEEFIFEYAPFVRIGREGTRYQVSNYYEYAFEQFIRNESMHAHNMKNDTLVAYTGERLIVRARNTIAHNKGRASSEFTARTANITNRVNASVRYNFTPKINLSAIYQNNYFKFKNTSSALNSNIEQKFLARTGYQITPKLNIFVQSGYINFDYYRDGRLSSSGFVIEAGAEGDVSEKIKTNFTAGYKHRNFYQTTINDYKNIVFEGAIKYRLTPKINISLLGKRDLNDSTGPGGWFAVQRFNAVIQYLMSEKIRFKVSSGLQRTRDAIETDNLTIPKARKNTAWIISAGSEITWIPTKRLEFALKYGFNDKQGNFDNVGEYVQHQLDSITTVKF